MCLRTYVYTHTHTHTHTHTLTHTHAGKSMQTQTRTSRQLYIHDLIRMRAGEHAVAGGTSTWSMYSHVRMHPCGSTIYKTLWPKSVKICTNVKTHLNRCFIFPHFCQLMRAGHQCFWKGKAQTNDARNYHDVRHAQWLPNQLRGMYPCNTCVRSLTLSIHSTYLFKIFDIETWRCACSIRFTELLKVFNNFSTRLLQKIRWEIWKQPSIMMKMMRLPGSALGTHSLAIQTHTRASQFTPMLLSS